MNPNKSDMDDIKEMFRTITTQLATVEEKLDKNTQVIKELKHENQRLKQVIREQEERIEMIEKEQKRNNIIIQGVDDKENEDEKMVRAKVQHIMEKINAEVQVETDIVEIRRLGVFKPNKKRPILAKLRTWNHKMKIFKEAKNLKGSDIWINEEFTKKVLEERKYLVQHLKQARQQGQQATLRYNKLIVDGKGYSAEDFTDFAKERKCENKRTASERSPEKTEFEQQLKRPTINISKNN